MKKVILALAIISLLLSGCAVSQQGIDSLLAAPKLSDEHIEIYNALEAVTNKNIKLKYPKRGLNTSAFFVSNIDTDYSDEAIVFYTKDDSKNSELPTRMNVLDQEGGKWVSKFDIGLPANEIDKIYLVNNDNNKYFVLGYQEVETSLIGINIFDYDGAVLSELFSLNCIDFEVMDINDNGLMEIIAISSVEVDQKQKNFASVYEINNKKTAPLSTVELYPDAIGYKNLISGSLKDTRKGLYIDTIIEEGKMATEILTWVNNELVNTMYAPDSSNELFMSTVRGIGGNSIDINHDTIIDIPIIRLAPGYDGLQSHEQMFLTDWYWYGGSSLRLGHTSYVDYTLGYSFTIPPKWTNDVTIDYGFNENEIIFYEYDGFNNLDNKILSIRVLQRNEYVNLGLASDYEILLDNGQLIYTYKIYNENSRLSLGRDEIFRLFQKI